jgi:hypothetical protein
VSPSLLCRTGILLCLVLFFFLICRAVHVVFPRAIAEIDQRAVVVFFLNALLSKRGRLVFLRRQDFRSCAIAWGQRVCRCLFLFNACGGINTLPAVLWPARLVCGSSALAKEKIREISCARKFRGWFSDHFDRPFNVNFRNLSRVLLSNSPTYSFSTSFRFIFANIQVAERNCERHWPWFLLLILRDCTLLT